MQACYVNTTHPDFINGHKVRLLFLPSFAFFISTRPDFFLSSVLPLSLFPIVLQAMSLVSERIQAAKGPEKPVDPKKQILNNNKDLDVDMKKDEPSFFSTFFPAGAKGVPKKKGVSVMESVSFDEAPFLVVGGSLEQAGSDFHSSLFVRSIFYSQQPTSDLRLL